LTDLREHAPSGRRGRRDLGSGKTEAEIPAPCAGVDLTKRSDLTLEEGRVAAMVDGQRSEPELALSAGLDLAAVRDILRVLRAKGVVQDPAAAAQDPYAGYLFPLPLMHAECGLNVEQRKRVIYTFDHLDGLNYYELLKVRRRDGEEAIKNAFKERSLEWHPDRFPRDKGPFAPMIERIFKTLQDARKTLLDEKLRAAHDEAHAAFYVDEEDLAEMKAQQRRRDRERRREEEKLERRKQNNPIRQRLEEAKEFHRQALEREEAGELIDALRLAKMAATWAPRNQAYHDLVARLGEAAGEHRIGPYMKKGGHLENMTRWDEAIECFEKAVNYAPQHGPAHLRLAYNLVHGGRDAHVALRHAQRAASLLSDEAEAHYVLGLCYERAARPKLAMSAYSRALELRPAYAEAKKRLKKLRWGF